MAESWRLCGELKATFQGNPLLSLYHDKVPAEMWELFYMYEV